MSAKSMEDYEVGLAEGRKQGLRRGAVMVLDVATMYFTQGRDKEAANLRDLSKSINDEANREKP